MQCQYKGCKNEAVYALYQLSKIREKPYYIKRWVQVCKKHDKRIAETDNPLLKMKYPNKTWREL